MKVTSTIVGTLLASVLMVALSGLSFLLRLGSMKGGSLEKTGKGDARWRFGPVRGFFPGFSAGELGFFPENQVAEASAPLSSPQDDASRCANARTPQLGRAHV